MLIELLTNNKKKKGPLFIIISWSKMRRNTDNPITHPSGWCWAPCAARLSTSDTGCERASVALRTPAAPAPPADHEPSLNQSPDHESPDWTTDDMNGTGLKRWNASSHESVSVSVCVCVSPVGSDSGSGSGGWITAGPGTGRPEESSGTWCPEWQQRDTSINNGKYDHHFIIIIIIITSCNQNWIMAPVQTEQLGIKVGMKLSVLWHNYFIIYNKHCNTL